MTSLLSANRTCGCVGVRRTGRGDLEVGVAPFMKALTGGNTNSEAGPPSEKGIDSQNQSKKKKNKEEVDKLGNFNRIESAACWKFFFVSFLNDTNAQVEVQLFKLLPF